MIDPEKASPAQLSQLLDVETAPQWPQSDAAAALCHQLAAPLLPDVQSAPGAESWRLEALVAGRVGAESFQRQLTAIYPSRELLEAIKRFARFANDSVSHPLRGEGAMVLYYAAIAAAMMRCNARITQLSDDQLREGFGWASDWLAERNTLNVGEGAHWADLEAILHAAHAQLPASGGGFSK